jgi:hypothetical protein
MYDSNADYGKFSRQKEESKELLVKKGWKDVGNAEAFRHPKFRGHSIQLTKAGGFEHYKIHGDAKLLAKGGPAKLGEHLKNLSPAQKAERSKAGKVPRILGKHK